MLCFNCNGGLGQYKDDPDVVEKAVQYLRGELVAPYLPEADPVPGADFAVVDEVITDQED